MDDVQGQEVPPSVPSDGEKPSPEPELPKEAYGESAQTRTEDPEHRGRSAQSRIRELVNDKKELQAKLDRINALHEQKLFGTDSVEAPNKNGDTVFLSKVREIWPNASEEAAHGLISLVKDLSGQTAEHRIKSALDKDRGDLASIRRHSLLTRLSHEYPDLHEGTDFYERVIEAASLVGDPFNGDPERGAALLQMAARNVASEMGIESKTQDRTIRQNEQSRLKSDTSTLSNGVPKGPIRLSWIRKISEDIEQYRKYEPLIRKAVDEGNIIQD